MSTIQTVRGPIDSSQLGVTLMHEHIFVLSPEIIQNYPEVWGDEDSRVTDAAARMNELYSRGVHTVVDLTVVGLGRYVPRVECVARQTKLNIIVATGIYTYNDLPFYFHFHGPGTPFGGPEAMLEWFVRDIREGIAGTNAKAGILKCCTDQPGLTPRRRACSARHCAGPPPDRRSDLHSYPRCAQNAGSINSVFSAKKASIYRASSSATRATPPISNTLKN